MQHCVTAFLLSKKKRFGFSNYVYNCATHKLKLNVFCGVDTYAVLLH